MLTKAVLEHIKTNQKDTSKEQKFIIFFDSQAALQNIEQEATDQLSESIASLLKNHNIAFQSISSHRRILDSERADRLTKEGNKKQQTAYPLSYQEVKTVIREIYDREWKTKNSNCSIKNYMMQSLPRKDQCMICRCALTSLTLFT
ncbi:hypothetical protein ElyMa_003700700 [Elysia marginata]|uniref:RNase H type-1 domain-containing protein n=1 Tax=Elysia marginata TaxID=1093978 RepID=A0AAV4F1G3_9GAST|nr:hypothetical protein ElyMa_003700700 [Elysia marginata]